MIRTPDITDFRHAVEQRGLVLPDSIVAGRIVRFPGVGKSNGNKSGWAWVSEDGEGAAFGDWATGLSETWQAARSKTMTPTEKDAHTRRIAELQRVRSEEERLRHEEAAQRTQIICAEAKPAPTNHPYLNRKGIQPHGLRVDDDGRLIVPVTIDGTITSIQSIDGTGAKLFQMGGAVKGGSYVIGDLSAAATILICEGFATGASLHEDTGLPVAIAFSAGNLTPVAEQLRQQFPTAVIVICGDHDVNGTGQREASKAANAVSGLVVFPEIEGYDFNDVHVRLGPDTVRKAIDAALHDDDDGHDDDDDKKPKKSQATQLVGLASKDVKFFHSSEGEPFADIQCGTHREIWPIKSKAFRHWLAGRFFQNTKSAIGGQSMQDALSVLSSKALFQGEEKEVSLRVAEADGDIYLDLGNGDWQAIRVTPHGWSLTNTPPVSFRRPKSMMALPIPIPGGSVDLLREVVNISDDRQWTLFIGTILAALRPLGPYPVLALDGEQGTGKSHIARTVKSLIDPARAGNRGEPRDVRDLMIAATNGWLLSFDNLSRISPELSDGLCRLSTGGGLATRELFSDAEETIFDARRPVVINAIGDVVTRPDLLDRSVIVTPSVIPTQQRREEHFLETRLNEIRPLVLGALLDAISHGLRTVGSVHLHELPRMADFAVWVTACAPALGWESNRFTDAYFANRSDAVEIGLEASPLVAPLRALLSSGPWEGTASELLTRLTDIGGDAIRKMKDWPTKPNVLSNSLKRLAPALRETGLIITRKERTTAGRGIHLEQRGNSSSSSSSSSLPASLLASPHRHHWHPHRHHRHFYRHKIRDMTIMTVMTVKFPSVLTAPPVMRR